MEIRCAVLGAGSWGTTVAHLLAHNTPTVLWSRDPAVAREVRERSTNERYLPGASLHPELAATDSMAEAVASADLLVMGVPSHGFRDSLEAASAHLRPWVPIVSLAKGLEQGTRLRMTEVINEVVPGHPYGVLTGPNLAKEILAGDAAASVLAMSDETIAARLQRVFCTRLFRVYTNPDVVGCEVAGALKNVIAIASGMADGLGTGDNTRAAVITRGLNEMARLGTAMGGQVVTFGGLAGLGDLLATCISPQSRNRHVGEQLGRGRTIEEIQAEMHMVAEGVKSAPVVMALAEEHGVEMPIANQVYKVLYEGSTAQDAYRGLLGRDHVDEMYGMRRARRR
ncbi:MAG: NAD(P)H-dependent glycerol-3-phosphate dehydrogenase [Acidimicrobiales bacterium]|jgi:glycerol-3-phosphate dehydrogenase (NAD(P)+)|nr:NAD(P)H-dependent glycerol-3-phosphate dehydrogenase [Acidimicrobiales bacterium]